MTPPVELENGAKHSLVPAARWVATKVQSDVTISADFAISATRPASVFASVWVCKVKPWLLSSLFLLMTSATHCTVPNCRIPSRAVEAALMRRCRARRAPLPRPGRHGG